MKKALLVILVLSISITALANVNYSGGIVYRFVKSYSAKMYIYPVTVAVTQNASGQEFSYFAPLIDPLTKYTSTNAITGSLGLTKFEKDESGYHISIYAQPYNPRKKMVFNPERFFMVIVDLRESKSKDISVDPKPYFESSNFYVWRFNDYDLAKKGMNINVWF